jgi:cbb3-type cytochrome oxidase maturation protein
MSMLYVLLPLALLGAGAWTVTFLWCVRNGQMDDLEGSAWRMLGDDEPRAQ